MKTSIIGAGPAANWCAYNLAKKGHEVHVYEEHKEIGTPVQCTGILTHAIKDLIPLKKEVIVNECKTVKVFAPNKKCIEFNLKKPDIIVCRTKLDQHLAELAQKQGAEYHLNHRFIKNNKKELTFNNTTTKTDIVIGADGPNSTVAKQNGFKKNDFLTGMQVTAKIEMDPNTYEVHLGYGTFGWVVPESETVARIGIVTKEHPKQSFDEFLKMRAKNKKILANQSGPIPLFNMYKKTHKEFIYLLGDAAGMVKASTHGGIVQNINAAECLAQAIDQNKSYETLWRKRIGKDLYIHKKIYQVMQNFSKEDHNELLNLLTKQKTKEIIENHNRDYITKFITKAIISQPKLLKFLTKLA